MILWIFISEVYKHLDKLDDSVNTSTLWSLDTQILLYDSVNIYLLCGLQTPQTDTMTLWIHLLCGLKTPRQTLWLCKYIYSMVYRHPDTLDDSVNISTLWSLDTTDRHYDSVNIYLLCGLQTPRHTRWLCEYIYFMVTHYMNVAVCKQ